jgi:hypothetical protein
MHNEYITLHCIKNERDKLLLLKYADTNITSISDLLYSITLELMNQCYDHVEQFHNLNEQKNKKYARLEKLVLEQLKDMAFIRQKFSEYFVIPSRKTKEDLMTYVLGFQIPISYYNEYLYRVLIENLKKEVTLEFFEKYDLYRFDIETDFTEDFCILKDTKEECRTGPININIDKGVDIIDEYVNNRNTKKLETIKQIGTILDNFYNKDFPFLNTPYKDYTLDLIDHIKVYKDFERGRQHIKRI